MIPTSVRRRRGALLYLFCSCSLLLICFFASYSSRQGDRFQYSRGIDAYPWQMISYDEYECGCPRSGPSITTDNLLSLCSDWSTSRGLEQQVISYSLYGNPSDEDIYRKYFSSLEDRLQEAEKLYEGFVVRLYHNLTTSNPDSKNFLCRLYCRYPHFDPCQVKQLFPPLDMFFNEHSTSITENSHLQSDAKGQVKKDYRDVRETTKRKQFNKKSHPLKAWKPNNGMIKSSAEIARHQPFESLMVGKMWRFLVMGDPLVSEFLVRDVDSSILEREVAAVEQWRRNSTALLHAMRDHPSHNGVILAGLWGGSRSRGRIKLSSLLKKLLKWPPRNIWDYDQMLLKRVVWPEVTDDILVHDSYFCAQPTFQSKHRSEPFPTQRKERYFVGWGATRNSELENIVACPLQCRPVNHQDWVLC